MAELHIRSSKFSLGIGIGLILVGVVVNIFATIHHIRLIADLKRGADSFARPSREAMAIAILFALIGAAMVVYMAVL